MTNVQRSTKHVVRHFYTVPLPATNRDITEMVDFAQADMQHLHQRTGSDNDLAITGDDQGIAGMWEHELDLTGDSIFGDAAVEVLGRALADQRNELWGEVTETAKSRYRGIARGIIETMLAASKGS